MPHRMQDTCSRSLRWHTGLSIPGSRYPSSNAPHTMFYFSLLFARLDLVLNAETGLLFVLLPSILLVDVESS